MRITDIDKQDTSGKPIAFRNLQDIFSKRILIRVSGLTDSLIFFTRIITFYYRKSW